MKTNFLFYQLMILVTISVHSQTRKISINGSETIKVINNKNVLQFEVNSGKEVERFNYGVFESDTSIVNKSRFLTSDKDSKLKKSNYLSVNDSIFLVGIFDWKDRFYVFLFKRNENGKIVPYMQDGKVKEFFVSNVPYIYFDNKCKVIYNLYKEILEYNYKESTKNYMIIDIYNLNDINLQQGLDINTIKLDADTFKFYSELYDNNSVNFFGDVYKGLDKYLNLCGS